MGEQTNSATLYGQIQLFSCDSFYVADRMGLGGTILHYLAVRKAIVSVHRPAHSCLPGKLTENGFQGAIKCQGGPFLGFASFLCAYCWKKLPEQAATKTQLAMCTVKYQSTA